MRSVWLLAALALVACRDEDDPAELPVVEETTLCPMEPARPGESVVLVHDTGFDPGNEVFQGRLGGCYRLRCAPSTSAEGDTFEQAKRATLDALARKDDSCHLEPGVTLRRSPSFERIEGQQASWNAAIRSGQVTREALTSVGSVVAGQGGYLYHGTAVAGLIAHQNPKARLVLVSDETILAPGEPFTCPSAGAIDRRIALYEDADVRAAYVAAPTDTLTDETLQVMRDHKVALNNESFGSLPSATLTEMCPGNWRRLFELTAELEAARTAALAAAQVFEGIAVLTLRAAGNEGATIDSPTDARGCAGRRQPDAWGPGSETVMVGALDTAWKTAEFSNRGACVDVFSPGTRLITWAPHDFLNVQSGTSFAAPLVARLVTNVAGGPPSSRRAALEGLRGGERSLPRKLFPEELQFATPTAAPRLLPPHRSPQMLLRRAFR